MDEVAVFTNKYAHLLPELSERARRLVVAADAKARGYGGISFVHRTSGMSRITIRHGIAELSAGVSVPEGRSRAAGGGRKKITAARPTIVRDLEAAVADSTRGDPESPLTWTSKSTRTLAEALARLRHAVSHVTVSALLKRAGYRLQANRKTREGTNHPDRDAQFRYIAAQSQKYLTAHDPVISVDTKKKELVGNFKNNGRTWRKKGKPVEVHMHDFPDPKFGKAVPYGIYDIGENDGYVNVGITHDTGEFSVESIRQWWQHLGKERYQTATRLLITADGGGSNGYRLRLWKKELQRLANQLRLAITVCHFPPGTSKWNKIEHRLFSRISTNWRGRPLTSYQVIVDLISATTTTTGMKVYARLDENRYELKKHVSDAEMRALKIEPHAFHGEWNYTILPRDA